MESEKKFRKKINTHIRAIVRECSIIMIGRNNKLEDQKAANKTYQKKTGHGSKGPFEKHMAGQNLHK